jgi:hypothetical protein
MSQWSPGMAMVGDMFNNSLKSKLDAVCTELAGYIAQSASTDLGPGRDDPEVSYRAMRRDSDWWPADLGTPSAVGAKMTFGTRFFQENWSSRTAGTSKFTTPAIIASQAWRKRKAPTKR